MVRQVKAGERVLSWAFSGWAEHHPRSDRSQRCCCWGCSLLLGLPLSNLQKRVGRHEVSFLHVARSMRPQITRFLLRLRTCAWYSAVMAFFLSSGTLAHSSATSLITAVVLVPGFLACTEA
jgi:hypothetical protein